MSRAVSWVDIISPTFGGHPLSDFNIGFLYDKSPGQRHPTSSAMGSCEHPASVGICETIQGYNTNTCSVVTTISRTEANTPSSLVDRISILAWGFVKIRDTYPKSHLGAAVLLHPIFGSQRILPCEHLDECMSFIIVHNAGLNSPILLK